MVCCCSLANTNACFACRINLQDVKAPVYAPVYAENNNNAIFAPSTDRSAFGLWGYYNSYGI